MARKQNRKQHEILSLGSQKAIKIGVHESNQKRCKSCSDPLCVHSAAHMVLQGVPEVPKKSPGISKWRHQAPYMATPRSQKGPAAEGVALKKFAAPPQGEQGVIRATHLSLQNLKTQAGLPTAAGPSKLEPKMLHFHASISARFFSCKICKICEKLVQKGPSLEAKIHQN